MTKKNNKGFTLIEVIAVVALIGILAVFAVPRIYDLITNSRNKVYVEDAIRLIAQARYSMNSKSVKIDKPEIGESIVFSMKYLSSGDFQNPPNGGSYLTESSFVVVKNIGGDFAYSAMLVEKTAKGQYIGVELSTENALNAKDAIKHVRTFDFKELGYIDEDASVNNNGKFVNSSFINDNLNTVSYDGNWSLTDDKIIGYYNNEIDDPDVVTDTSSPKVTAKFSTSGSLQTVLSVYATDSDNVTSELRVFVKVSSSENDTYPNPNTDTGEPYGNEGFYSKEIDFGVYGFSYDNPSTAYVYILVADPNNNYTRKRLSYDIHENEPPVIKGYSISQLTNKDTNMPKVKVNLTATDDMDKMEDLYVCFAQDSKPENCSGYRKYSELFDNTGSYTYNFKDARGDDILVPDGSSHTLVVYVKDSLGLATNQETNYEIYSNTGPRIVIGDFGTSCAVMKNGVCQCSGASCNSLTAVVNLNISDDITDSDDIRIKLYHKVGNEVKGLVETTYGQFRNSDQKYTFSGEYDGNARKLYVEAIDEYGVTTSSDKTLTGIYKDSAPAMIVPTGKTFITSAEPACDGTSSCTNSNSYSVNLNFQVTDDITSSGDLKVCVSETKADCESSKINTDTFVKYSEFDRTYEFSHEGITGGLLYPHPALTKSLYAAVVDAKGNYFGYNNLNPIEYTLYNNHNPKISGDFTIASTSNSRHLRSVKIAANNLEVADDFEKYQVRFCYKVGDEDTICSSYENFNSLKTRLAAYFEYTDSDNKPVKYTGQTIVNYFEVKDNYGATDKSNEVSYQLYADSVPTINSFTVKSINTQYNSNTFEATFDVLDYEDTYTVCVATNGYECTDDKYIKNTNGDPFDGEFGGTYTIEVDGMNTFGWSSSYEESNLTKTLTLYVKDSNGKKNHTSTTYTLYELCSSTADLTISNDSYDPVFENGREISPEVCSGMCFRSYVTTNNHSHINYETKNTDGISGNYKKKVTYHDNLVNNTCDKYNEITLKCDYVDCFNTGEKNINVVGMKLIDENTKWYYSNEKVKREVLVDKPYCENPGQDAYFYPGDSRCSNRDSLCDIKVETYCSPIVDEEEQEAQEEFQEALRTYELEQEAYKNDMLQALADYLLLLYPDEEEMINTCIYRDDELNSQETVKICADEETCEYCKTNTDPDFVEACQRYDGVECSTLHPTGEYVEICSLLATCQSFNNVVQGDKADFYETYYETHPKPLEPIYITRSEYEATLSNPDPEAPEDPFADKVIYFAYDFLEHMALCKQEHISECYDYYSFCSQSFTSYKESVNCSENTDITPIYCRSSGFSDGHCLENDNTCSTDDDDCIKVCYKNYNCQEEYEARPVVFTCNGYYKTYETIRNGDSITLQETPLRLCPDFVRLFDAFSEYRNTDSMPYIRFNPDEIG